MPPIRSKVPLESEGADEESGRGEPRKAEESNGRVEGNGLVERPAVRIAVSLDDLERLDAFLRAKLLGGKLDGQAGVVRPNGANSKEAAVAFACPALLAAQVCDVLRGFDRKAGDPPTRCWVFRKAWSRVPGHVPLSIVDDEGRHSLNPALFAVKLEAGEVVPPASEPARPMKTRRDKLTLS